MTQKTCKEESKGGDPHLVAQIRKGIRGTLSLKFPCPGPAFACKMRQVQLREHRPRAIPARFGTRPHLKVGGFINHDFGGQRLRSLWIGPQDPIFSRKISGQRFYGPFHHLSARHRWRHILTVPGGPSNMVPVGDCGRFLRRLNKVPK